MAGRPDYSRDRDVMTVINHMREAGYPVIMPNSRMAHDIYLALNKVKNNNYTQRQPTDMEHLLVTEFPEAYEQINWKSEAVQVFHVSDDEIVRVRVHNRKISMVEVSR